MTTVNPIDATLSINEIIRRVPASIAVLNEYGIDTCCGGAISLAEAAAEIAVAPDTIVRAIEEAAGETP